MTADTLKATDAARRGGRYITGTSPDARRRPPRDLEPRSVAAAAQPARRCADDRLVEAVRDAVPRPAGRPPRFTGLRRRPDGRSDGARRGGRDRRAGRRGPSRIASGAEEAALCRRFRRALFPRKATKKNLKGSRRALRDALGGFNDAASVDAILACAVAAAPAACRALLERRRCSSLAGPPIAGARLAGRRGVAGTPSPKTAHSGAGVYSGGESPASHGSPDVRAPLDVLLYQIQGAGSDPASPTPLPAAGRPGADRQEVGEEAAETTSRAGGGQGPLRRRMRRRALSPAGADRCPRRDAWATSMRSSSAAAPSRASTRKASRKTAAAKAPHRKRRKARG